MIKVCAGKEHGCMRTETHHSAKSTGAAGLTAQWAKENPRSAALAARAAALLPGGVTHDVRLADPFPVAVARAAGSRKTDLDGHELICYVMGRRAAARAQPPGGRRRGTRAGRAGLPPGRLP